MIYMLDFKENMLTLKESLFPRLTNPKCNPVSDLVVND